MVARRSFPCGCALAVLLLAVVSTSPVLAQAKADAAKPKADAAKADATKSDAAKPTTAKTLDAKSAPADAMKFEVYQDSAKAYRWRLVTGANKDRQVLATGGQGYKAKADCMNGVKALEERTDKLTFETYEDKGKEFRWRAKATNGQVMAASSSSYKTKADCDAAVDSIKKNVSKATVDEVKDAKA